MSFTDLDKAFTHHLRVKNYKPLSIASYRLRLRTLFDYLKERGIKNIEKVTPLLLREYRDHLEQRHQKGDFGVWDYAVKVRAVKRFFKFMEETAQIIVDPALHLCEPEKPKGLHKTPLTHEQMLRVLELPDLSSTQGLSDRTVMQLLYANGVRLGELINLTLLDLDADSGFLRVSRAKNGKSRMLPLTALTLKFIKTYMERSRKFWLERSGKTSDHLFVNRLGAPLSKMSVERTTLRYGKLAGILKPLTPHIFRHTFCNELLKGGANVQTVADLMGHSRANVLHVYSQPLAEDVKKTVEDHHPIEKDKDDDEDDGKIPA